VYYFQDTTTLSHSDEVLYISSHQGNMFRPQFCHHQANTEHKNGTTKWALTFLQRGL